MWFPKDKVSGMGFARIPGPKRYREKVQLTTFSNNLALLKPTEVLVYGKRHKLE
jgi:hypothetical protein